MERQGRLSLYGAASSRRDDDHMNETKQPGKVLCPTFFAGDTRCMTVESRHRRASVYGRGVTGVSNLSFKESAALMTPLRVSKSRHPNHSGWVPNQEVPATAPARRVQKLEGQRDAHVAGQEEILLSKENSVQENACIDDGLSKAKIIENDYDLGDGRVYSVGGDKTNDGKYQDAAFFEREPAGGYPVSSQYTSRQSGGVVTLSPTSEFRPLSSSRPFYGASCVETLLDVTPGHDRVSSLESSGVPRSSILPAARLRRFEQDAATRFDDIVEQLMKLSVRKQSLTLALQDLELQQMQLLKQLEFPDGL